MGEVFYSQQGRDQIDFCFLVIPQKFSRRELVAYEGVFFYEGAFSLQFRAKTYRDLDVLKRGVVWLEQNEASWEWLMVKIVGLSWA